MIFLKNQLSPLDTSDVNYPVLLVNSTFTCEFHAFIREFHAFTREFHAFTREFHAFTCELCCFTREFHAFTREFRTFTRELCCFTREFHAFTREFHAFTREFRTFTREFYFSTLSRVSAENKKQPALGCSLSALNYTHHKSVGLSLMSTVFRLVTARWNPSSTDISGSSCSMLTT